ncbi:MAG TPA: hypothetical protein V6D46_06125 [Coleofasciculaceae cyanobacterium]
MDAEFGRPIALGPGSRQDRSRIDRERSRLNSNRSGSRLDRRFKPVPQR